MAICTLMIDGRLVSAREDATILAAAKEASIEIPTLCHFPGIQPHAGCRLCLVEIVGQSRPQPACITKAVEGMIIFSMTDKLLQYRKMVLELLFAERNHICSVCIASGDCELQKHAASHGVDHIRFDWLAPSLSLDLSHPRFGIDHNRCILCTRCVRVCNEIESANTWDVMGRGQHSYVITDLAQPWGESATCTACGKCVETCPTGALFHRQSSVASMTHHRERISLLVVQRGSGEWNG